MNISKTHQRNRKMVVSAILGAITIVLGMTPLGFIPLGVINATTMHIPVIIASIVEGPVVGAVVGLIFGVSSLLNAILKNPTPVSFVFFNPIVSVLPRVLIGITSYYAYNGFKKLEHKKLKNLSYTFWIIILGFLVFTFIKDLGKLDVVNTILLIVFMAFSVGMIIYTKKSIEENFPIAIGAFIGSMTNTILVLGSIYLIYAEKYMTTLNLPVDTARKAILGVSITSGIPEAILSVIITTAVVRALPKRRSF